MRVLLLDAYAPDAPDRAVVDTALETLTNGGHDVTHRQLVGGPFEAFMSAEERLAYHGDQPLITPETKVDAEALAQANALIFCYPTTLFTIPAVLKSWLERVLVVGVAFVFDEKGKVEPGMGNIRRLGAVTTTPHSAARTRRLRDSGRRSTLRNIRLSCHPLCRRTWVSVEAGAPDLAKIKQAYSRW